LIFSSDRFLLGARQPSLVKDENEREGGLPKPETVAHADARTQHSSVQGSEVQHLLKKLFRRASTPRVRMSSSLLVRASSAVSSAMRNWLRGLIW